MSSLSGNSEFASGVDRAQFALTNGRAFWRSLEELADSQAFQQWLHHQHPQFAHELTVDRRRFLKFIGASLALAGVTACSHPPQDELVPYVHSPLGQVDGLPRFFATTLVREGYAQGVLVESHMGRPTKVEGNPEHPASLGATDIFVQAAILQLWDPDRSQTVMRHTDTASWDDFAAALVQRIETCERTGGSGLRVLTGTITSPTVSAQLDSLLRRFPQARWHVHQPAGNANAYEGARLAFGAPRSTRLHLDRAKVIVSLEADFLTDSAGGVRYARDFAATRTPESTHGAISRLYVLEATPSLTGGMADHRWPLESDRIADFARRLAQRLGVALDIAGLPDARQSHWLDALVADLQANRGASLIAVGPSQPPWMHALGHVLNSALGNVGATIDYSTPVEKVPDADRGIVDLVKEMRAGSVDTLLILDCNPAYDAPADLNFAEALRQVPHMVHLGLYTDETGALAEWHLPLAHQLETWSDARAYDGSASIAQPLIAPLYAGRSVLEVLAMMLEDGVRDARAIVRRQWREFFPDDAAWNEALQSGVIANTALPSVVLPVSAAALTLATPRKADDASLELLFRPDPTIGDGFWSNNGWLQELPKPLTQLTWDNPALISPQLAAQHELASGDVVELHLAGRMLRVPVWVMPGQAARSVTLHLGYGRRRAGRVGNGQGFDAYVLRASSAAWNAGGLRLQKTGDRHDLAATQHHFNVEGRDLLRVGTFAEYQRDPHFANRNNPSPTATPSLYPDYPPGEYAWGMSIDLNACIGCKVCTIACQAENNIPVVGKEQVQRGREMHWIRVDRYYEGTADNPRTYSQPVPCMMCEHAPCEVVCPVGATVHDDEGLNLQVYNRCVGTRFCSNNCPYKVRRFNFLQFTAEGETLAAQRNPEVTVRQRGVMEKCTYCIQRIETAHIEADKANRRIRDAEVLTACQAACPTQAIRFGDIADANSSVAQAKSSPRTYVMLGELNTRPRTSYLARLRNPNPALPEENA